MKLNKILFPTDFSKSNRPALEMATSLARDTGARLLIVHVKAPPPELVAGGGVGVMELGLDKETIQAELQRVVPTGPSTPYEHHLLTGSPAAEIVRFANEEGVDLIVMSTHGRTGLMHLLMGSVAEAVVRHAACPVVTVRARPEPPTLQAEPVLISAEASGG
jgi:nucleotide-binding universal stress UspA family protein